MDNSKQQKINIDEPIGKSKPTKMVLAWFFSTLIIVFPLHWGLLEPLNFWNKIYVPGILSWVNFSLTSIIIAAMVSIIRLTIYYNTLYRSYRDNAWVDNLYITRAELQGKYKSLIRNATNSIDVFGISLHTLVQNPDTKDAIIKAATSEPKVKFRFLLHHPECQFIKERSIEEGKKETKISEDCEKHLNDLIEIMEIVKSLNGSIEIGTLKDKMPDCFFLKQDDNLFVEPYLYGYVGRDCPVICLKKNNLNAPIFEAFTGAMQRKWNDAHKYTS